MATYYRISLQDAGFTRRTKLYTFTNKTAAIEAFNKLLNRELYMPMDWSMSELVLTKRVVKDKKLIAEIELNVANLFEQAWWCSLMEESETMCLVDETVC